MATTNVPALQITPAGVALPDESAILAGTLADIDAAFGGGLNLSLETPQGQLASSLAAIIGDKNDVFAEYVNQVDPDYAAGRMQDAIARIYFIDRHPARSTVVQAECIGQAGTIIPVGSLAVATDRNIYASTQDAEIPDSGTVTIPFACQTTGPIACPSGTLTSIYRTVPGWDRINNSADGVVGNDVESRAEFEFRRANSVALNATGSLPAIYANVLAVDNVLDAYVTENTTSAPITKGSTSYSLVPHSIYVAAVGGVAADIAQAIWLRKNTGADYNGNTSVIVQDKEGYEAPYPQYTVKFEIPDELPILFAIEIASDPSLPQNIVDLVKAAVVDAFNGGDGGQRARIGARIYASRFYAPIQAINNAVEILSVLIGTSTPTLNALTVGIDQVPTINAANVAVTLV